MQKKEVRIGVFDSGIGGLTVLKECAALLPQATFYYLGDNFRAPYGSRGEEEILRFTSEAMDEFAALGVDAAVLACNTATAVCADALRVRYGFPIVGIEPAVKLAARSYQRVMVLATPRTIESARLHRLTAGCPDCAFVLHALPDLARLIERAVLYGEPFDLGAQLPERKSAEAVVLGCTHYIFYSERISAYYKIPVFDGNFGTARHLALLVRGLKSGDLGIDIHQITPTKNEQMYGKVKIKEKNNIIFLGKAANLNKSAYFQTFVL